MRNNDYENDYEEEDYVDYGYDDEESGCGEGFSCDQCDNYGCPANPNN